MYLFGVASGLVDQGRVLPVDAVEEAADDYEAWFPFGVTRETYVVQENRADRTVSVTRMEDSRVVLCIPETTPRLTASALFRQTIDILKERT